MFAYLQHEDASEMMFNFLIKDNNLQKEFTKYKLDENDQNFIREQIIGPKKDTNGVRQFYIPNTAYLLIAVAIDVHVSIC